MIEAIVEDLEAKRELFRELEVVVARRRDPRVEHVVAVDHGARRGLKHPGRIVGMHFFNPAPVLPLVEVVSGLATDAAVAETIYATARGVGQDAGARGVDAGLHRQPLRAAVLRRGAAPARRARGRPGDARRGDARGRRLPDGAVRADGPDRPRRQLRGDEERLGGVLPRPALRAVGPAAGARRGGLPRPQVGARLLRLRAGRREARAARPKRREAAAGARSRSTASSAPLRRAASSASRRAGVGGRARAPRIRRSRRRDRRAAARGSR